MSKSHVQISLWSLSLQQIIELTAVQKPAITGGAALLGTSCVALSLVLMSLEISKKRTRQKRVSNAIDEKLQKLKQCLADIKLAAEDDLAVFDKLRAFKRVERSSIQYHDTLILAIESPLKASKILKVSLVEAHQAVPVCNADVQSDISAACLVLEACREGLFLFAKQNIKLLPKAERELVEDVIQQKV